MKTKSGIKKHTIGLLAVLSLEYVLGMITTFFVQFPEHTPEGELWQFVWKQPALTAHIIVGLLLFIGAIALIIRAIQLKNKIWIISSVAGYLGIQLAVSAGSLFIPSQSDIYSFVMSLGFLIAFVSYYWGIYKNK